MAEPMGFYKKQGLNVNVVKASSWAMIRDLSINGETDATHMLSPMPLAISMGVGSQSVPYVMPALENINGQAITLHIKHKGVTTAAEMKGFKFGVPFDYSMHNFLLRYVLAEGGVDPDKDVQIRAVPPPEMVANLRAGNLDGYLGPDPFNQRAVFEGAGFIWMLSKDIWPGHPCCAFAAKREFAEKMPNTFKAVLAAIIDATQYAHDTTHRKEIAAAIAPRNFLNQPVEVVEQVLTGVYPDGLGATKTVPDRIDFDPFPYQSMAVWILTQMKRWGYVKTDVTYKKIAEEVFLASACRLAGRHRGRCRPGPEPGALSRGQSVHPDPQADLTAGLDAALPLHDPRLRLGRRPGDLHVLAVADARQHRVRRRQHQARLPARRGDPPTVVVAATDAGHPAGGGTGDRGRAAHLDRERVGGHRGRRDADRRDRHRLLRVERVEQPGPDQRDLRDHRDRAHRGAPRRRPWPAEPSSGLERVSVRFLDIDHVSKDFAGVSVFSDVAFSIAEGEFVTMIGHSGCGKSTLLNIIAGLEQPSAGGVVLSGREITG